MSPTDKRRSPAHRHRSFKGCWTCKKKRIQCDEVRPACGKCSSRGIICEGYEVRLRWGTGIASRGKYSGAEKPVEEYIPPPSKRKWNMRDKGKQSSHVTTEDRQKDAVLVSRDLAKGTPITDFVAPRLTVAFRTCSSTARASGSTSDSQYTQFNLGIKFSGREQGDKQTF